MAKQVPFLTLAEYALASLANARRLYDDASHLLFVSRFGGAHVLAVLAAEEFGKHIISASFAGRDIEDDAEWENLWKRLRFHTEKLNGALIHAWFADLLDSSDPPSGREAHTSRLSTAYVDVDADGRVQDPANSNSQQDATVLLERLGPPLRQAEKLYGSMRVTTLAEQFERTNRERDKWALELPEDGVPDAEWWTQERVEKLVRIAERLAALQCASVEQSDSR